MNTDVKEKIFAEQAKKGMIQFDMEKFIYDFTHLYKVILNSMDEYAKAYAPVPGKEESYWQRRCEAAEYLLNGVDNNINKRFVGYKEWQTLKEQEPASPSTASNEDKIEVHVRGISKQPSDAVEFAEWIAVKEYITTTLPHEDVQLWQYNNYDRENDKLTEGPEITTQELYNLFLADKNKNEIQQAHDKSTYQ